MLAGVVARLIDVGGRVHASPKAYDHPGAPGLSKRTIVLAAVEGLRAAEDTAMDSGQVSKVGVHGRNYPVSSLRNGTSHGNLWITLARFPSSTAQLCTRSCHDACVATHAS